MLVVVLASVGLVAVAVLTFALLRPGADGVETQAQGPGDQMYDDAAVLQADLGVPVATLGALPAGFVARGASAERTANPDTGAPVVVVTQRWVHEESGAPLTLFQDPRVTGILGDRPADGSRADAPLEEDRDDAGRPLSLQPREVTIGGWEGEEFIYEPTPGRPYRLISQYWRTEESAYVLSVGLTAGVTEDVARSLAKSVVTP
ncbi:MAG: hypothetical protein WD058_00260 [Dehalococcoidia bacterium]